MTNLAINDLALSKELDRDAMHSHLGGRGLGRSALFAFFLPSGSGVGGSDSFVFNVSNTLNQVFVDTLQFNQLNQITNITDSANSSVDLFGNTDNSNFQVLGFSAEV